MGLPASTPAGAQPLPVTSETRLHWRWLKLSRVAWLVVGISTLALFVGSLPAYYLLLQTPCGSAYPCGHLTGALDAAALQRYRHFRRLACLRAATPPISSSLRSLCC